MYADSNLLSTVFSVLLIITLFLIMKGPNDE